MLTWINGLTVTRFSCIRPKGTRRAEQAPPRGHPQNGKIESFNGRLRDECLNQEWFTSLFQARCVLQAWKDDYNTVRPHSALHYQTPDQWARNQTQFSTFE